MASKESLKVLAELFFLLFISLLHLGWVALIQLNNSLTQLNSHTDTAKVSH